MSIWNAAAFVRWRQRHLVWLCENEAVANNRNAACVVLGDGACNTSANVDAVADAVRGMNSAKRIWRIILRTRLARAVVTFTEDSRKAETLSATDGVRCRQDMLQSAIPGNSHELLEPEAFLIYV